LANDKPQFWENAMKTRLSIVPAAALALALAACGSQDEAADATLTEDTAAVPEAEAAAAPDPSTPQGFVATQASSDMYEIEAGRLAQEMGQSDETKEFGGMMVEDHTASSAKLKTAVDQAGAGVTVPTAMLPKHQQNLDALRNAGTNFDSVYAQQQVMAHQEALALLQGQAQTGMVASLKAFAAETAPIVETHLEHARTLASAGGGADAGTSAAAAASGGAGAGAGAGDAAGAATTGEAPNGGA
jgi:putative membrane protein